MSLVERGLAQAEPMPVLEAVASALGTPLPAGIPARSQPTRPAGPGRARTAGPGRPTASQSGTGAASAARALRLLATHRSTAPCRAGQPRAHGSPARRYRPVVGPGRACRYDELADLLGRLLPELSAAGLGAPGPPERATLEELIAASYQACSAALCKLGEHESAKAAASRALAAAQRAGKLLLAAASAYLLTRILMEVGRYPHAEETARKAAAALTRQAAGGRPEAVCLRGALVLLRALIAARAGDTAWPMSISATRATWPCAS